MCDRILYVFPNLKSAWFFHYENLENNSNHCINDTFYAIGCYLNANRHRFFHNENAKNRNHQNKRHFLCFLSFPTVIRLTFSNNEKPTWIFFISSIIIILIDNAKNFNQKIRFLDDLKNIYNNRYNAYILDILS